VVDLFNLLCIVLRTIKYELSSSLVSRLPVVRLWCGHPYSV